MVVAEIRADVEKALRRRARRRYVMAKVIEWPLLIGHGWKLDLLLALASTVVLFMVAREWGWRWALLSFAVGAFELFLILAVVAGLVAAALKDHDQ